MLRFDIEFRFFTQSTSSVLRMIPQPTTFTRHGIIEIGNQNQMHLSLTCYSQVNPETLDRWMFFSFAILVALQIILFLNFHSVLILLEINLCIYKDLRSPFRRFVQYPSIHPFTRNYLCFISQALFPR